MSQFEKKLSPDYYRLYPRPTFLLLYKEPKQQYNRRHNLLGKRTTSSANTLSRNSSMKMRRSISWLVSSAEEKQVYEKRYRKMVNWRINFITLTVPLQGDTDDKKLKRLLNEWFKWAKYNHGLNNYVWKAEVQKRGEIHFHVMTDCYIHYTNVTFSWNRLLAKGGFLNGHKAPNSTDIHAVIEQDVKNVTAYAVDYMMKKELDEDGNVKRSIKGRLWGCSKPLSNAGKSYIPMDHTQAESVHNAMIEADWKCKQVGETACYMYFVNGKENLYNLIDKKDDIHEMYSSELKILRSDQVQLTMFQRQSAQNIVRDTG